MNLENTIERFIRELNRDSFLSYEYESLYAPIKNKKLSCIFSSLHALLTSSFECMNERLPTTDSENHFWANPSRDLLKAINLADSLIYNLKYTEYSCDYADYYKELIVKCKKFLSISGGSTIPVGMDKVELYYTIPIFCFSNIIKTPSTNDNIYPLKIKGSGSYADVFFYEDDFYNTKFAVKRAHKDLTIKELERFRQEFDTMKSLNSPYILTVYNYNDSKNQYIMEYMDKTLDEFIKENNTILKIDQRKNLIFQVLKAFEYLHSKHILHRDISPKNILLKLYENLIVVKISDFGLVKIPESTLTSENSELKGCFNDPSLIIDGFSKYNIEHETYALTRLVVYILTGKTNLDKIKDSKILSFINKGLNPNKNLRFKSVAEIKSSVIEML